MIAIFFSPTSSRPPKKVILSLPVSAGLVFACEPLARVASACWLMILFASSWLRLWARIAAPRVFGETVNEAIICSQQAGGFYCFGSCSSLLFFNLLGLYDYKRDLHVAVNKKRV
jgi:hypothetical protein